MFGSVARGQDRPDGDVGLLVNLPPGLGLFGLGRVQADLEAILGTRVDLVLAQDLPPGVRASRARLACRYPADVEGLHAHGEADRDDVLDPSRRHLVAVDKQRAEAAPPRRGGEALRIMQNPSTFKINDHGICRSERWAKITGEGFCIILLVAAYSRNLNMLNLTSTINIRDIEAG